MSLVAESGKPLDRFRLELFLTFEELWIRYLGLGGGLDLAGLTGYLTGGADIGRTQHNTIAHALNEHFVEQGRNHPVPYLD